MEIYYQTTWQFQLTCSAPRHHTSQERILGRGQLEGGQGRTHRPPPGLKGNLALDRCDFIISSHRRGARCVYIFSRVREKGILRGFKIVFLRLYFTEHRSGSKWGTHTHVTPLPPSTLARPKYQVCATPPPPPYKLIDSPQDNISQN